MIWGLRMYMTKGTDMRDIIARVAAGTTTVEDAHELEKALAKANVI